jgi:Flp pilus assembly pilin Flp
LTRDRTERLRERTTADYRQTLAGDAHGTRLAECHGMSPIDFARDERGALAIEYIVVTTVGLMVAAALGGLGMLLVDAFGRSLKVLYSEFP